MKFLPHQTYIFEKGKYITMNLDIIKNFCDRMADERTPGCSVRVYLKGRPIYSYDAGVSSLETGKKMQGDEFFWIYSCSKVATVTGALKLVEDGIILINDPVYEYIPEWRDVKVKRPDGTLSTPASPVTIGDLFSMTAGMDYNFGSEAIKRVKAATGGKCPTEEMTREFASEPLWFDPGTKWQYSLCHDVLAGLVGIVSGMPFRDYMRERVFLPLGMEDTYYHANDRILSRMAEQYTFVADGSGIVTDTTEAQIKGTDAKSGHFVNVGKDNPDILGDEYDSGGAGIVTTADDYAKLCGALANGGRNAGGERIISEASIKLMTTNRLSEEIRRRDFNWWALKGYGYGLGVRVNMDAAVSGSVSPVGEFGWGGAAGASVVCDRESGLGAFFVQHTLNPREEWYQPRLRNILFACL